MRLQPLSTCTTLAYIALSSGLRGHVQKDFNLWPIAERIDSTTAMLRDLMIGVFAADAFVCSGTSNVCITAVRS